MRLISWTLRSGSEHYVMAHLKVPTPSGCNIWNWLEGVNSAGGGV
jgi:hypothetical protein